MQYLYNDIITRKSYNITSVEEVLELMNEGIISPHTIIYNMEEQSPKMISEFSEFSDICQNYDILYLGKKIENIPIHKKTENKLLTSNLFSVNIKHNVKHLSILLTIFILSVFLIFYYYFTNNTVNYSPELNNKIVTNFFDLSKRYINKETKALDNINKIYPKPINDLLQKYQSAISLFTEFEDKLGVEINQIKDTSLEKLVINNNSITDYNKKLSSLITNITKYKKERVIVSTDIQYLIYNLPDEYLDLKTRMQKINICGMEYGSVYQEYLNNEILIIKSIIAQVEYVKNNINKKFYFENENSMFFYSQQNLEEYNKIKTEIESKMQREQEIMEILSKLHEEIISFDISKQ